MAGALVIHIQRPYPYQSSVALKPLFSALGNFITYYFPPFFRFPPIFFRFRFPPLLGHFTTYYITEIKIKKKAGPNPCPRQW